MLFRSGMPVVAGLLIAAWAGSLQAAVPNDLASYMPEETAVYVGWSAWQSQDRVQLELAAKLLESTSERQEGPPRVTSVILLELLLPMSKAPVGIGLQNIELNDGAEVSAALIAAAGQRAVCGGVRAFHAPRGLRAGPGWDLQPPRP